MVERFEGGITLNTLSGESISIPIPVYVLMAAQGYMSIARFISY